jgi:sugar/nucleoside kinase (ribokinase family)
VTDRPVILVFGAINQDEVARVRRHPVPCETVVTDSITFFQGGKGANQAFAAAVAGGDHVRVQMVGAIGDDAAGEAALASLHSAGVDTGLIKRVVSRPTGRACITVDDAGQNAIVVGLGANAFVSPSNLVRAQRPDVAVAQTELGADAIEATVPLSPIATACVSARVREPHMSSTPRARGTRSLGALAAALAAGDDLDSAIAKASSAATRSVAWEGARAPLSAPAGSAPPRTAAISLKP